MTGKLLKYELKSSYQYMLIIWGAILLASIIIALVPNNLSDNDMFITNLLQIIPYLLYGAAVVALGVAMIFIIVIRFYRSLMGDEGYLMHTLPVREWELIVSKALAATIYTIASIVVVFISFIVFMSAAVGLSEMFSSIGQVLGDMSFKVLILCIEVLILMIFGILKSLYQVYASLAIGQLIDNHRILLAVGAYVGISVALIIIGSIMIALGDAILSDEFMATFNINPFDSTHEFLYLQLMIVFGFIIELVQVVIFHIITERIMTKKLNLL